MDGSLASMPSVALLRLKNLAASTGVVLLAWAGFHISPANRLLLHQLFGTEQFSFTGEQFVVAAASSYVALLAVYYLAEPRPQTSKSVRFWQVALEFLRAPVSTAKRGLAREDRVAVLATLLKAFFAPLMAMALMTACVSAVGNGVAVANAEFSLRGLTALLREHGFAVLLQAIIVVDVVVFTVGYLVELPALRNEIKSVDPTLLGWAAALLCYTPFNLVTISILGWQTTDHPQFENPTVHLVLTSILLLLMAMYSWASVALGFKASNLTHRGIVEHGPYRYVRHPAYACKNVAWWIGCIPFASAAFERSLLSGLQVLAAMVGLNMLYVLRAVTEEDHLRSVDGDYAAYAAKVRYRFIPGIV